MVVQESRSSENLHITPVRKIIGKELQSRVTLLESDDRPVSINGQPAMDETTFTSNFLRFNEFVGRKNPDDKEYCRFVVLQSVRNL
jgi:hypothetical protein